MESTGQSSAVRRIHAVCDDFESELKRGVVPRIEAYLERLPEERRRLLRELLSLECAYRRLGGAVPTAAEYAARFPDDADLLDEAIDASRHSARSAEMLSGTTLATVAVEHDADESHVLPIYLGMTVGKYRLISRIGAGGMGTVFLAAHTMIDLPVALKVMQPRLLTRPDAQLRFLQEAQAAVRLHHKNIVLTRDVGEERGLLYITMELLDGENLSARVKRHGPMSPEQVLSMLEQATDALGYAHRHGVVHRDIKPHNLMLLNDGNGTIKILDLGLARFVNEIVEPATDATGPPAATTGDEALTGTGNVMGTPGYMAPEQARDSRTADVRSDVYSLGCTAYYLLTGKPPKPATSEVRPLEPLETVCSAAPVELRRIVERMTALAADERYPSMAEAAAELKAVRRRYFFHGWVPGADDAEGLRRQVFDLELVDAETLAQTSARRRRTTMTEELPDDAAGEDAFELLRLLGRIPRRGLTQFQIEQIMTGRIERLRLPRHVVVDQVNNGWKGEVYRARRCAAQSADGGGPSLDATAKEREEAIRTIPLERLVGLGANNAERGAEFLRRLAQIAGTPAHPLVARLYDGQLTGDVAVAAAELTTGPLLSTYLADVGSLASEEQLPRAVDLMCDMCDGLRHVHESGLLHLDLSPDRWVVRADGRAVLLDGGLAPLFLPRRGTEKPGGGGGPPVPVPELLQGWEYATASSDVFALGHLFRFVQSGKFPFRSMRTVADGESATQRSGTFPALPKPSPLSAATTAVADSPQARIDRLIQRMTANLAADRPDLTTVRRELDEIRRLTRRQPWTTRMAGVVGRLFRRT